MLLSSLRSVDLTSGLETDKETHAAREPTAESRSLPGLKRVAWTHAGSRRDQEAAALYKVAYDATLAPDL